MNTIFWSENLKESDHLENLYPCGMITTKRILKKEGVSV
jgi:hypothetical protein